MKTTRYDVWMANLGPSEALLLNKDLPWREFVRRYKAEIQESTGLDRKNTSIKNHGQKFTLRLIQKLASKGNVTLMCHCDEEEEQCHRHVLKRLIERV